MRSLAYLMCAFCIALYFIIPNAQHAEAGLHPLFAFCALAFGIYFLLMMGSTTKKQPKWEKVFPELHTETRQKIAVKRKFVNRIYSLMDIYLIVSALALVMEIGFDWRSPLISALILYIFGLIIRSSLPAAKDYSWEIVYPELALGFDEDEENK
jgi:hypothetical protein